MKINITIINITYYYSNNYLNIIEQINVTQQILTLSQLIKLQNIHSMVTNENITIIKLHINKLVQIKQQEINYKIKRRNLNT